jgi:hypothetical protein
MRSRSASLLFVATLVAMGLPLLGGGCSSTPASAGSCAGVGGTIQECKQDWTAEQCANWNALQWNGSAWVHDPSKSCAQRGYAVLCANPGANTYAIDASNCEAGPAKDAGGGGGGDTGTGSCTEGWYRCDSDDRTILKCVGGAWTTATSCGCTVVESGNVRVTNCKASLTTTGGVDCSYAFVKCLSCTPGAGCQSQ